LAPKAKVPTATWPARWASTPRAITVARNLATRQANGEIGWAPQLREPLAFVKITTILVLDVALANLVGGAPNTPIL